AANIGLALGEFMLGKPNTYSQNGVNSYNFRGNYAGMYAQDTWTATSRLTVNAGIRWDPYLPMYWKDGVTFHFDPKWFDQGTRSSVYTKAPAGVLYSGDAGVPNSGKVQPNQWGNFSPRLGLAWDPKGNGRMTVRSSYGIFRDYPEFYKFQ